MSEKRIASLDGVRALAMLMVVYFHFWQQNWLKPPEIPLGLFSIDLYPVAAGGFVGVELLFVLSGFLLFLPLAKGEKLCIRTFYTKRIVRIFPCYALCVLVCGLFAYEDFASVGQWLVYAAKNLLFLNTFSPDLLFNRFNSVLWSTAVEMWFYLLFPFLALAMLRAPRVTALLAFVGAALYRLWVLKASGDLPMTMNQLPGMIDCFVGGMFTAYIVAQIGKSIPQHGLFSAVAAAGGALFLFLLTRMYLLRGSAEGIQYYQIYFRTWFVLAACMLIGGSALAPQLYQRIMGNRLFAFLGAISFNLYLWHQWLSVKLRIWQIPPYAGDPHYDAAWQWQHMLLSFVLSIALAALLTYGVERPVSRLFRRREKLASPPSSPDAAF